MYFQNCLHTRVAQESSTMRDELSLGASSSWQLAGKTDRVTSSRRRLTSPTWTTLGTLLVDGSQVRLAHTHTHTHRHKVSANIQIASSSLCVFQHCKLEQFCVTCRQIRKTRLIDGNERQKSTQLLPPPPPLPLKSHGKLLVSSRLVSMQLQLQLRLKFHFLLHSLDCQDTQIIRWFDHHNIRRRRLLPQFVRFRMPRIQWMQISYLAHKKVIWSQKLVSFKQISSLFKLNLISAFIGW